MVDAVITSPCTWQTVSDIINSRSTGGRKIISFPVLATEPTTPAPTDGETYFDSTLGKPRIYYSGAWHDIGGSAVSSGVVLPVGATTPTSPVNGQAFFDTTLGHIRVWDGATWVDASGGATGTVDWADLLNVPPLYYKGTFTDSTNITVNHKMKKYPTVRVLDTAGTEWVYPNQVIHTDLDNIIVKFNYLFGGTIWLS